MNFGYMINNSQVLSLQNSRESHEVRVVREAGLGLTVSERAGINGDNLKETSLLNKVVEKLQNGLAEAKEQIFVAVYPHNKQYLNDQAEYIDALELVTSCIKNPGAIFCGKLILESKNDKLVQCFIEAKSERASNTIRQKETFVA